MGGEFYWWKSCRTDWLVVGALLIGLGIAELAARPRDRFETCRFNQNVCNYTTPGWDATLGNPWSTEATVSSGGLIAFAIVTPTVVIIVAQLILKRRHSTWQWQHDAHHAFLAVSITMVTTLLVTAMAKRYVGYFRPSYYSLISDPGISEHRKQDGRQSYPSGHSSLSFASMGFLTLYSLGKTRAFAAGPGQLHKILACMTFLLLAGFVATSRIVDYRHHPADVNAGSAIGFGCAIIFYHVYFNPVWVPNCQFPRISEGAAVLNSVHDGNASLPTEIEGADKSFLLPTQPDSDLA